MSSGVKLLIRCLLSIGLAIIVSRFFFHRISYPVIIGLVVFFVGMATISERIGRGG
jgi:hypothetical protein